ncbi:hypothetical protein FEM03_19695 [Phragmitibacter flavus]|uniref:Uncharacterized protein n=1 Tax=Phragmitibacter flavus TaxID=2576071 RepID=A0A5R8K9S8_9BACT|nr:c-type cytochrome domain-containing protein [Phragmitibacter flavus]TLD69092.1 hypothetical protein FEM03_19695 [Phragmitibacter flavus]
MKPHFYHPLAILLTATLLPVSCTTPDSNTDHDQGAETAPEGLTVLDESATIAATESISFVRHVKPVLESKCLPCHSPSVDEVPATGPQAFVMTRGTCKTLIVPGKPDQSRFLALASTHHNLATMPPVGNRLTKTESQILERWITQGAHWPEGKAGNLKVSTAELRSE